MSGMKRQDRGGFHSIIDKAPPYTFIDATMQAWPDADYKNAHRHGVTAYAVTAWRPHASFESAIAEGMEWHRLAREHDNLVVAETVEAIRDARKTGRAAFIVAAQGADWVGRELHRVEGWSVWDFASSS